MAEEHSVLPVDKPIICPVVVGREPQLQVIEDAIANAVRGKGQTVLVAGDAGVGKSRLVAEARARASDCDILVLQGNCFEPDRSLPYGPMIDLLRAFFSLDRPPQEVARRVSPAGLDLVDLLPELVAQLPRGAPSAPLEPEAEKRRLFHALIAFFTGLAMERPLLIVIEDAHWSDETSLEFLVHLARAATSKRILLVVCYRSEEAHPSLMRLLAALDRDRLAIELPLRPLSRSEVDAMVRAIFGLPRPLRPEYLQSLYELTDGYPFFVEEILRSLVHAGAMPSAGGLSALDIFAIYVGDRLGYYRALGELGPATPAELAEHTITHERYAREWLEQQAVTGILAVDDPKGDAQTRRYTLEPGHAEVLLNANSLSHLVPLIRYYVGTVPILPHVIEAYRTGGGVPWTSMGRDIVEAQEGFNRTLYTKFLGTENLPSIPDVDARLRADPPARVADIGCGAGWSSIAVATAYPKVVVSGFDFDPLAIEIARRNAVETGVADRVAFEVRDSTDLPKASFDLVMLLECLHDMPHPVEVLRGVHERLAGGGAVIVMDERVAEEFSAPGDDIDRMMYGWSIVQCLPGGMAEAASAGTGAVMRPGTLRHYAAQAGFAQVEILPIDNDPLRRWYRLIP